MSRVYKGTVYADQVVTTRRTRPAAGSTPEVGSTWVIFASGVIQGEGRSAELRLTTTLCSGNLSGSSPPRVLGRASQPCRDASDRTERADDHRRRLDPRPGDRRASACSGWARLIGIGLAYLWRPSRTT